MNFALIVDDVVVNDEELHCDIVVNEALLQPVITLLRQFHPLMPFRLFVHIYQKPFLKVYADYVHDHGCFVHADFSMSLSMSLHFI